MATVSTLLLYAALLFPGTAATEASYGQVIEAMAERAAKLQQPRLLELVSDVGLQVLERRQWRERHPCDTLREVARRLRALEREARRSRAGATQRKREARARAGRSTPSYPVAREQVGIDDVAASRLSHDIDRARLEARDELTQLGFQGLQARDQQLLVATEVMQLRYAAAAELLGLDSADAARHRRNRLLAELRASAAT